MKRIVLLFAIVLCACGPSARQTQIKTMLVGVNAASDGFMAFSKVHADAIIDGCDVKTVTEAECKAKLEAYRVKEAKVVAALSAAYNALSVAVTLNDSHTMQAAITAVVYAQQAWTDLKEVK